MNERPFFSICIPSYNRPQKLRRLLQSIDYSGRDAEVVIAEDNSPLRAETRKVAEEFIDGAPYAARYIENEENLGFDKNLRELIKNSSGEYIIFMGDDDEFVKGALDKFGVFLGKNRDLSFVLRTYHGLHSDGDIELFKYFPSNKFFPKGVESYKTLFRKSVFISGLTFKREHILPYMVDNFDGTLLFQLYILAETTINHPSAFYEIPLTRQYIGEGIPFVGSAPCERGLFTPGVRTIESSINFMQGFFKITDFIDKKYAIDSSSYIKKDISKYSYPILAVQRDKKIKDFLIYAGKLINMGIANTVYFYIYALALVVLGKNVCDKFIRLIKIIHKKTPSL